MKQALYLHFTAQGYAVLEEFCTSDAGVRLAKGTRNRRIDVLCIRPARRLGIGPWELLAIEVKVSRGDFRSDIRNPAKQAPWRELAHRHAYAAPDGLIVPDEVPDGHGLLTVSDGVEGWDKVRWAREVRLEEKAPKLPARFLTTLAFRAATAEANARGRNPFTHLWKDSDE